MTRQSCAYNYVCFDGVSGAQLSSLAERALPISTRCHVTHPLARYA